MKTERIEFVAPLGLKARLQEEASRNNISVGELIRQRFDPTGDELELAKLTEELKKATTVARSDFARAIGEVSALVDELRSRRGEVEH